MRKQMETLTGLVVARNWHHNTYYGNAVYSVYVLRDRYDGTFSPWLLEIRNVANAYPQVHDSKGTPRNPEGHVVRFTGYWTRGMFRYTDGEIITENVESLSITPTTTK